jgi:hypothetical protein
MNLQYTSGKKFQDSTFQPESFELLKKDEQKKRLLVNIIFIFTFLLFEYIILTIMIRF